MLYVEIGLPHTEFIPRKKLVDPPRLLPDYSKMSARYSGIETMTQFEIKESCNRLSKPRKQNSDVGNATRINSANDSMPQRHHNGTTRFVGKKKMASKDIKSLVDRLSNTKSPNRVPDSQRIHTKEDNYYKGVVASHAWNGCMKHYPKCSYEFLEKYVHKLRGNF